MSEVRPAISGMLSIMVWTVGVDQAGHQGLAAAVDDDGVGAAVGGDGIGGDFLDLVAADQHVGRGGKRVGFPVEDADVLEQGDTGGAGAARRRGAGPASWPVRVTAATRARAAMSGWVGFS